MWLALQVPQECEVAPEVPVVEDANHLEAFKALVGEEDAMQLEGLLAKIAENKELKDLAPILLAPDSDKAHRAASRLISGLRSFIDFAYCSVVSMLIFLTKCLVVYGLNDSETQHAHDFFQPSLFCTEPLHKLRISTWRGFRAVLDIESLVVSCAGYSQFFQKSIAPLGYRHCGWTRPSDWEVRSHPVFFFWRWCWLSTGSGQ